MEKFLSCDWGTSRFRLRLVQVSDFSVMEEESSDQGIHSSFTLWKQSRQKEEERLYYYLRIIKDHIHHIETRLKYSLKGVPVIVSGMASSTMGMKEIPYQPLPVSLDGTDMPCAFLEPTGFFNHDLLLISGCSTADDVMRGEETKMIGCSPDTTASEEWFIFPGTHSKHVLVKDGSMTAFSTFMTGEFFDLLSNHSILSGCVEKTGWADHEENRIGFELGVMDGLRSHILQSAFWVRTNQLFDKLSREENYFYLSGLLIGSEISALNGQENIPVTLVSDQFLGPLYEEAMRLPSKDGRKRNFQIVDAGQALIRGQYRIFQAQRSHT